MTTKMRRCDISFSGCKSGALGLPYWHTITVQLDEVTKDAVYKAIYDAGYERVHSARWRIVDDQQNKGDGAP